MKTQELRQLIREEIRKVVNESRVNESSNTDVEGFLNEGKPTWFPQSITVLKDIYTSDKSTWTSTGPNGENFLIKAPQILSLSRDGSSQKTKAATYECVTTVEGGKTDTDYLYFELKELVNLIKEGAIKRPMGLFGHDITLNSMLKK